MVIGICTQYSSGGDQMNSTYRPFLLLFAFMIFGSLSAAYSQSDAELRASAVLFHQFETVAHTNADFLLHAAVQDATYIKNENELRFPFFHLLASLNVLGPNATNDILKAYSSFFSGAKDFAMPEGLGMVSSTTCIIGVTQDNHAPYLDSDLNGFARKSDPLDGQAVWTWSIPNGEGSTKSTTYYAAQIADVYFVMATDRKELEEAAHALSQSNNAPASRPRVFDWKTFSTHKYWIYRSIRREGVKDPMAAAIKGLAPDIMAEVFYTDIDKPEGVLRIQSSNQNSQSAPNIFAKLLQYSPDPQNPGVWQAKFSFSSNDPGYDPLFYVSALFGFGMAL
jgi:hypothetical protein